MDWLAWVLPMMRKGLLASGGVGGEDRPGLGWLETALDRAGLVLPPGSAAGLTLMAPSDAAVAAAGWRPEQAGDAELQAWLLRHLTLDDPAQAPVLAMLDGQLLHREGGGWRDGAGQAVLARGRVAQRGGLRLQVIDRVLPPLTASLRDGLRAAPGLHRFCDALDATGLSALLDCAGPFTVFAPSERGLMRAAARLGLGGAALWSDRAALTELLLRHVVSGRWASHSLPWGGGLRALSGERLVLSPFGELISGDLGLPLAPGSDQGCRNGVLHRIDEVLLPPVA